MGHIWSQWIKIKDAKPKHFYIYQIHHFCNRLCASKSMLADQYFVFRNVNDWYIVEYYSHHVTNPDKTLVFTVYIEKACKDWYAIRDGEKLEKYDVGGWVNKLTMRTFHSLFSNLKKCYSQIYSAPSMPK